MDSLPLNQIIQGDALSVLRTFPDESVHCVITSPPYWGLRKYSTEPVVWDGDPKCAHEWGDCGSKETNHVDKRRWNHGVNGRGEVQANEKLPPKKAENISLGNFCRCGAWKGNLGLEPTIDLYVRHLTDIFREVRRVLREGGTLWLNLGDSYATGAGSARSPGGKCFGKQNEAVETGDYPSCQPNRMPQDGLKPKDLVGIPWMVAFALRADGWWLRSDIIWHKPNPMPESVTDRPTKSHEYVFLLAKSQKYYYDAEAIAEKTVTPIDGRGSAAERKAMGHPVRYGDTDGMASRGDGWTMPSMSARSGGRNRRSVWTIATQPFSEAHFATFPEGLVQPCILAGTSERGACLKCGSPWERTIESTGHVNQREGAHVPNHSPTKTDSTGWQPTTRSTNIWAPTCGCGVKETRPCVVLDPFMGSGTTALVARKAGRDFVGIELSADYIKLAEGRIAQEMIQMRLM